jgi:primosomal protein N' (replication factor Y)
VNVAVEETLRAAAAGDYQAFFEEEIFRRRSLGDPPFSSLAEVVLSAADARALGREARALAGALRSADRRLEVLGPSEVFHPEAGAVRSVQIVVRTESPELLDGAVADALRDVRLKKQVIRAD